MLTLPSNAELVLVNGKEDQATKNITLPNGQNQLALRYLGRYRQQGAQTQFSSDLVILTFSAKDTEITLKLPRIRSEKDADAFNREPKITLLDPAGHKRSFKQDKLLKEGIQLGRDYEAEIKAYNHTRGVAAVKPSTLTHTITSPQLPANIVHSSDAHQTATADPVDVGKMLDFWYNQADEATKKAFKLKINQQ